MTTTLDWYGCATFCLKTAGLDIFLDAYIDRADTAAGPGIRTEDISECDWILIGHSHFDHLYGAERIAAQTGAKIIGSYETVRIMEQAGVPLDQLICVSGGETIELGEGVTVRVLPSLHSCVWSHSEMSQADVPCVGDLGVLWHDRQERFAELVNYLGTDLDRAAIEHLQTSNQGDRGDGGALVYFIETPDGSIFYQDTSGHWSAMLEEVPEPDVAILAAAGRGNIDGDPIQGSLAQFVGRQVELLDPKKVVLCHHDNWLPGFSIDTDVAPIEAEMKRLSPGTKLVTLGYVDGTSILG